MKISYDIVIIGGGMVGASMACALQSSNFNLAVIEAYESNSDQQPSFDERTIALTWSSKLIFDAIGVWQDILAEAWPIVDIEVTSQDSFGLTALGTEDTETEALGYVVPTRRIGKALHSRIRKQKNIEFLCPATVKSIHHKDDGVVLDINHQQQQTRITARLVILADGGRSGLLEQAGFTTSRRDYPQSALVGIIGSDTAHLGKAYEHFTSDGPLALLPVRETDYALAWTLQKDQAQHLSNCDPAEFLACLKNSFGRRAGSFISVGNRSTYPLTLSILGKPYRERVVIIGNAAHIVHPVAGQGFNLGLRDVGFLHQVLQECADPGDTVLLENYANSRTHDTQAVSTFTDGLIQIFTSDFLPAIVGRNLGLAAINLFPPLKRELLKRTMGIHGRLSHLAMRGKRA